MDFSLRAPALLFCPADRPERYEKALAAADVVVLDLEDAVAVAAKEQARRALVEHPLPADRAVVRVNSFDSGHLGADLDALRATGYRTLMLPKAEDPTQPARLAQWQVVALCETPRGVLAANDLAAAPNVVALMWGAEDLIASMGGRSSRDAVGRYRDVCRAARSQVLLAATAHGRQAIDAVYVDFADDEGLTAECVDAVNSGFALKACIHPRQTAIVRRAFAPDEREVAWADRVVEAAGLGGVAQVDGVMVDGPLVAQARRVLDARRRLAT